MVPRLMGPLLDSLKKGSPFHRVETDSDGMVLVATGAHQEKFDLLVRDLLDHAGQGYAAFPVTDPVRRFRYERVLILPIG